MENTNELTALIPSELSEKRRKTIESNIRNYLEVVKRDDMATLGDGDVFVRKDENGFIKAVSGFVTLRENQQQVCVIQGRPMITAQGYLEQNKIASCTIITPEKLILPITEQAVPNPYPVIDPKSGTISKVWVKKLCLGRNPVGNWVVTSCTLLYDINMYFLQDCYKKIQNNKNAGRVTMKELVEAKEEPFFFPIHGDIGIVINPNDKDILKCIDTFIQRKLFAERNAQTICERIVMRKHPAFASSIEVSAPDRAAVGRVRVIGWTNDISKDELIEIARNLEKGEDVTVGGKGVTFDDETITELTSEDVLAGENEFDETANNEPAFEEEEPETPETPETPEESETGTETEAKNKQKGERQSKKKTEADKESQSKLLESISSHKAVLGEEQFNKLFKTAFGEADISLSDLKLPQLNMFNKLLEHKIKEATKK